MDQLSWKRGLSPPFHSIVTVTLTSLNANGTVPLKVYYVSVRYGPVHCQSSWPQGHSCEEANVCDRVTGLLCIIAPLEKEKERERETHRLKSWIWVVSLA